MKVLRPTADVLLTTVVKRVGCPSQKVPLCRHVIRLRP